MRLHGAPATTPARHAPGDRIAPSGHVAFSASADGGLLVDARGGRRTRLDHFGCRVWQALSSRPTIPALMVSLRDDGTGAERLAEDVTRLLARWQTQELLEWR